MQLILLGAPGSGKGTQAQMLTTKFGFKHVSTGDLLRDEVEKGSELGKKVKAIIDGGNLVDDFTVLELLKANCNLKENVYIFDGFPRNLEQAKLLNEVLLSDSKFLAVYFEIDLNLLIERVVNRRVAPKSGEIYNLISKPPKNTGVCDISGEELVHRKDDNEETVRNRMAVFNENIKSVLDFYEGMETLEKISVTDSVDAAHGKVCEIIEKRRG